MARRLYPHNRIAYWQCYSLEDICKVFKQQGLHVQTVRKWIQLGLATIDNQKPALIYGYALIQFIKTRNDSQKCATVFNELYCLKCQDGRTAYRNRAQITDLVHSYRLSAHCRECKTRMFKNYPRASYPQLKRTFGLVAVLELNDTAISSVKTHIQARGEAPVSESSREDKSGTTQLELWGNRDQQGTVRSVLCHSKSVVTESKQNGRKLNVFEIYRWRHPSAS